MSVEHLFLREVFALMVKGSFVTTQDPARLAQWERQLGAYRLPIKVDSPRWQCLPGGDELCFDLDTARLHPLQLDRLALTVAAEMGLSHAEARRYLESGGTIPISARGCEVE